MGELHTWVVWQCWESLRGLVINIIQREQDKKSEKLYAHKSDIYSKKGA